MKVSAPHTIRVGDTLWMIDFRDGRKGWEASVILGETRQSWLVGPSGGRKVLKKTLMENHGANWGLQRWYTTAGKEAKQFCDKHARSIGGAVDVCDDPEKLKKIADIIGLELK